MGLIQVPPGSLAAVVTSLEMRQKPRPRPLPLSPLRLGHWRQPGAAAYRALFRRVGAPWLWFSRLLLDDAALLEIIADPDVALYVVSDRQGVEVGFAELDFRARPNCEIAFLGLVPELTGQAHGRWLMAHALSAAWRTGVERVWLHSCTLDHHHALGFYRAQGFVAFARAIESFADPRLAGLLPRDAAPHVPLLDPAT